MNRIKNEIKNALLHNLLIVSMLFVQLLLCFMLSSYSFISSIDVSSQAAAYKETYESKDFYKVWDTFYDDSYDKFISQPNYIGKMEYVYNKMCESEKINFFSIYDNPVEITNAPDRYEFLDESDHEPEPENFSVDDYALEWDDYNCNKDIYYSVKCIWIDKNGLKENNISPKWGRGFEDHDFEFTRNGDTVPVILGYNYREYFNIGDMIKGDLFYAGVDLKIIGFFDKGVKMLFPSGSFSNLDDYVMVPLCDAPDKMTDEDADPLLELYSFKLWGFAHTDCTPDEIQLEVARICKEVGFEPILQVQGAKNYESAELAMDIEYLTELFIAISATLLIFSVLSIILFTINYMRKNLKYYAILLANGYTYADIIMIILGIPFTCVIAAVAVSIIFLFVIIDLTFFRLIIYSTLILTAVGLIIVTVSAASIYHELKKHDLSAYLRQR